MRAHSARLMYLGELFDGQFRFCLPWFQRAYCWTGANVLRLVADIVAVMSSDPRQDYCLGTVMLARSGDGRVERAIIDGHQRVMTLTILFAVLRDLEPDRAEKTLLDRFIRRSGSRLMMSPPQPHLDPPQVLARFLNDFVQQDGVTLVDEGGDRSQLSVTERNILTNRDELVRYLSALTEVERRQLGQYLAERCTFVVRLVSNEDAAWRMLQIEEETRLNFHPAAQAKASLLSVMPSEDRHAAAETWETWSTRLGNEDVWLLLSMLRTLRMRRRREAPVESDLCKEFKLNTAGREFVETAFARSAEALVAIRTNALGPAADRSVVAERLKYLSWLERDSWLLPLIHITMTRGAAAEEVSEFLWRLERLGWLMRLASLQPATQENHYIALLDEIDTGIAVNDMSMLHILPDWVESARKSLRSHRFGEKDYAARILRRISAALGEDPGPPDRENVTIEHICPRNPDKRSMWVRAGKGALKSVETLGNLVFLSRIDNVAAANLEWNDKRKVLAASSHVLARHAAAREWTSATPADRTEELIGVLLRAWKLVP